MSIMIPRVKLGRTNFEVSRLGCGLIRLGRKWAIDAPGEQPIPDRKAAQAFLRAAAEAGINFFDTAPAYGESEAVLGEFLRAHPELARDLVVSTKCGKHLAPGADKSTTDFSPAALRRSIENSLRLLGGHIHLLSLHSITPEVLDNEETIRTLEDVQAAGDADQIGISSTESPEAASKAIESGRFSTIQVPYNLVDRSMKEMIRLAGERGVGVVVNRPLATGLLTTKFEHARAGGDHQVAKLLGKAEAEVIRMREQSSDGSLARQAWQFVFGNPLVSTALTGTRNIEHLRENLLLSRAFFD